jgi:hypothetical protein
VNKPDKEKDNDKPEKIKYMCKESYKNEPEIIDLQNYDYNNNNMPRDEEDINHPQILDLDMQPNI